MVKYEYNSYPANKKLYSPSDIVKMFDDLSKGTVSSRFRSKYAEKRWGVKRFKMPDGTYRKYVTEEGLQNWKQNIDYRGRPITKAE